MGILIRSRNKILWVFSLVSLIIWITWKYSYSPEYLVVINARPVGGAKWPITLIDNAVPKNGPGENGSAFPISRDELTGTDLEEFIAGEKLMAFNLFASDRISLRRSLPDNRLPECKKFTYPIREMQAASVVICFHNEGMSTLLRTIYSVVDRSPKVLLHEIVLVDDGSNLDFLHNPLEEYINLKFDGLVKLVRTGERVGLIRARLMGADAATGDVLIFLDSHCEATEGWIEPLLYLISKDKTTVVAPNLGSINNDTMAYKSPRSLHVGGFTWNLIFTWHYPTKHDRKGRTSDSDPIRAPTISGGLFAISREYFFAIGSYDSGMDIWGAENLELSFRAWMCHGHVYIHPCSMVGHIFRSRSPYVWRPGKDVLTINRLRLAHVWLDDYKKYYFDFIGTKKNLDYGDISQRVELRDRLKCNSFQWYIDNVYPSMFVPSDATSYRQIRSLDYSCLDSRILQTNSVAKISICSYDMIWYYTSTGEIRNSEMCLDFKYNPLKMIRCHSRGGNQYFSIDLNGTISCGSEEKLFLAISNNGKNVVCEEYSDSPRFLWKFKEVSEIH